MDACLSINLRKRAKDTMEPTESGSMSPQKRKFSFSPISETARSRLLIQVSPIIGSFLGTILKESQGAGLVTVNRPEDYVKELKVESIFFLIISEITFMIY